MASSVYGPHQEQGRVLLAQTVGIASTWLLWLLISVRRLNRYERQSFVNSFCLLQKVTKQNAQIEGKTVELLALFSNPAIPAASPVYLPPLRLGQELKFLLRAVSPVHLTVEPAATLADVETAVRAHNPRIILFSGHAFMGSLAFELPDGRIDLPPPEMFTSLLQVHLLRRETHTS